jgi:hypothetical protein
MCTWWKNLRGKREPADWSTWESSAWFCFLVQHKTNSVGARNESDSQVPQREVARWIMSRERIVAGVVQQCHMFLGHCMLYIYLTLGIFRCGTCGNCDHLCALWPFVGICVLGCVRAACYLFMGRRIGAVWRNRRQRDVAVADVSETTWSLKGALPESRLFHSRSWARQCFSSCCVVKGTRFNFQRFCGSIFWDFFFVFEGF